MTANTDNQKFGLSSFGLKVAAVILMLIDHAGAFLFPEYEILRIIGRLSFPVFAFLICEGYEHTKNIKKYGQRLLIFAVITEPFFDLAKSGTLFTYTGGQNVLWTFLIGVITIYVCENQKTWIWGMVGMIAAEVLQTDYSAFGVFLIMLFWYQRKSKGQIISSLLIFAVSDALLKFMNGAKLGMSLSSEFFFYVGSELFSVFSFLILFLYNGKRGGDKLNKTFAKYFFYVIYPLQFLVFYLLKGL